MKFSAAVGFCAVLALCVVESSARSLGGGPASAVLTRLRRGDFLIILYGRAVYGECFFLNYPRRKIFDNVN